LHRTPHLFSASAACELSGGYPSRRILHDLHESVPYLYDNTVGDGPYNAWVDPILADEWQLFGWNNMAEMTKFGMPGAIKPA
jgi:hypothetical protein